MANGSTCCALEICCPPAQRRTKLVASLAAYTGAEIDYCEKFLDWMDQQGLVFAPVSFQHTIDVIAAMAKKHAGDQ